MDDRPIIKVDYGLASSYDDGIEINRKLSGELRQKVIMHEKRHGVGRYNKQDFVNDFQSKSSTFKETLLFAIRNPEALIGFFPFMYSYHFKIMTYNSSALWPFLYFGLIFSLFWKLTVKIPFFQSLTCYSGIILLINIVLLVYTHRYWKNNHSH